jgi:hypothetical protein
VFLKTEGKRKYEFRISLTVCFCLCLSVYVCLSVCLSVFDYLVLSCLINTECLSAYLTLSYRNYFLPQLQRFMFGRIVSCLPVCFVHLYVSCRRQRIQQTVVSLALLSVLSRLILSCLMMCVVLCCLLMCCLVVLSVDVL